MDFQNLQNILRIDLLRQSRSKAANRQADKKAILLLATFQNVARFFLKFLFNFCFSPSPSPRSTTPLRLPSWSRPNVRAGPMILQKQNMFVPRHDSSQNYPNIKPLIFYPLSLSPSFAINIVKRVVSS